MNSLTRPVTIENRSLTNMEYFRVQEMLADPTKDPMEAKESVISLARRSPGTALAFIAKQASSIAEIELWKCDSLAELTRELSCEGFPLDLPLTSLLGSMIDSGLSLKPFLKSILPITWHSVLDDVSSDRPISSLPEGDADILGTPTDISTFCVKFRAFQSLKSVPSPHNVPEDVLVHCLTQEEFTAFTGCSPSTFSRVGWVYSSNPSILDDPIAWEEMNSESVVLPSPIALLHPERYAPMPIASQVRRELFGSPFPKAYERLASDAESLWKCAPPECCEDFKFVLLDVIDRILEYTPWKGHFLRDFLARHSHRLHEIDPTPRLSLLIAHAGLPSPDVDSHIQAFSFRPDDFTFSPDILDSFRAALVDPRFLFGFGLSLFDDDLLGFLEAFDARSGETFSYNGESGLSMGDVAAWFGAERVFAFLRENGHSWSERCFSLAVYGGSAWIVKEGLTAGCGRTGMAVEDALLSHNFKFLSAFIDLDPQARIEVSFEHLVPVRIIALLPSLSFSVGTSLRSGDFGRVWLDLITSIGPP